MTPDQQRQRPSHHVVHDYANLLSSGEMVVSHSHKGQLLIPPINTHVAHAFYLNCRKMYDFFMKPLSKDPKFDDLRAVEFTKSAISYSFKAWSDDIHDHFNKALMHVARVRTTRPRVWEGYEENPLFLQEFTDAWKLFIDDLKDDLKDEFKEEIQLKVTSADCQGVAIYSGR
jgi:hypothetical protein